MAIPSDISQGVQLGVESVYGTDVTADTKLQALSLSMTPDLAFESYRTSGNKFTTSSVITQVQSAANIDDSAVSYTEIQYPLSSLMGAATITTPGGGTLSRQWEFAVSASGADAPKSFTYQAGDGTTFLRANGVVINSLNFTFEEGAGVTVGGDGFGGALTADTGVMDTTSGTQPALIPANWTQVSVYMDDLPGTLSAGNINSALGTTKRTGVMVASPSFGDRYSLVRALDAAQAGSPVAIVETPVTFQVATTMAADAFGRGLITYAMAGTPMLIRVEAVGPIIEGSIHYKLTFDTYAVIADGGDEDERNGARVINWTWDAQYSSAWDAAHRIRLVNAATSL
jgi:hypothetical protein